MTTRYDEPPPHLASLRQRITNLAGARSVDRLSRALAGVVVGQMLPAGVVKGGTAMRLRLGHGGSRFTPDLDMARAQTLDDFVARFRVLLTAGWQGFTGRLVERKGPSPTGVPAAYLMKPYHVRLAYRTRSWLTVEIEVGHDELGDTDRPEFRMAADLSDLLVNLGFGAPSPIPVLAAEHQIAQKIHACSEPGSERAHDLVDLQLLVRNESPDLAEAATLCRRLFISRHGHAWPPAIAALPVWESLYEEAAEDLDVLPNVDEAVRWVNELITTLDTQ